MYNYLSPAKINLSLHITGKRTDGFHNLQSLVAFTDFSDDIFIKKSNEHSLTFQGEQATNIDPQYNSITKVIYALERYTDQSLPVSVKVTKHIPSGAGLGGGSSNAATLFHALIDLYNLDIPLDDLNQMALSVGSDVPACLLSTPLIMQGRGELCTPAPSFPTMNLVIIKPPVSHATIDIYKNLSITDFSQAISFPDFFDSQAALMKFLKTNSRNDLEKPALNMTQLLASLIKDMGSQKNCYLARMSGSGSAVFGVFDDTDSAEKALNALQKKYPALWGISTHLIGG